MPASELIHHFATTVLESGRRQGFSINIPPRRTIDSRRWTGRDFVRFAREFAYAMDDSFYGLAEKPCPANSAQFGVELMVLSHTLGDALDRYARFYALVTQGLLLELQPNGNQIELLITASNPSLDPDHFLIEWYATRLLGLSQWLIGREIPQLEVEFAHSRRLPLSAYTSGLGKKVSFDRPSSRLIFPRHVFNQRVIRNLDDLNKLSTAVFDPDNRGYLLGGWGNRLKASLRANLYDISPLPTMEELARQFGVSSQTLRRGLKAEGSSYRQIKAEARREVVERNISDMSLTLSQVSVLAGFAETNGLVRAMKSWTGLSLTAFRRSIIEKDDGDIARPVTSTPESHTNH